MIKIKKLNKYYNKDKENEIHVLKDLDFHVEKNKYISIMGTSGVGKSTLLNIIGGLENFDSGEYIFDDIDMSSIKESKLSDIRGKRISFVFQDYMLIEDDTVLENVKTPLYFDKRYKFSELKKVAEKALKRVGLDSSIFNKPAKQLSGGQKQRVAIARAISNNPDVLLADEPTGAVDEKTSEEILKLFNDLVEDGITIIIVTHDKNVAEHTQKIYYMEDGKFV